MIRALKIILWLPVAALFLLLAVSFARESRDKAADRALADSVAVHQARAASAIEQALVAERRADSIADLRRADSLELAKARSVDDALRRRLRRVATTAPPDPAPAAGGPVVTLVLDFPGTGQTPDTLSVPAVVDSALTAAWTRVDRLEVENVRLQMELLMTDLARDQYRVAAEMRGREASLERERRAIAQRTLGRAKVRSAVNGYVVGRALEAGVRLVLRGR